MIVFHYASLFFALTCFLPHNLCEEWTDSCRYTCPSNDDENLNYAWPSSSGEYIMNVYCGGCIGTLIFLHKENSQESTEAVLTLRLERSLVFNFENNGLEYLLASEEEIIKNRTNDTNLTESKELDEDNTLIQTYNFTKNINNVPKTCSINSKTNMLVTIKLIIHNKNQKMSALNYSFEYNGFQSHQIIYPKYYSGIANMLSLKEQGNVSFTNVHLELEQKIKGNLLLITAVSISSQKIIF